MLNLLGLFGVGYLAAAGVATNAAVVGRGLVRAARSAVSGDLGDAAVEALGAAVAPAVMTFAAAAGLVIEAVNSASTLAQPVRHHADAEDAERWAA